MQRRLSPGGDVFLCRFTFGQLALNGESRASLSVIHGLPKYAWRLPTKTRRGPVTPVRNTFPERAAVSPAVTKPIPAYRYRTVIETLSKGELRFFRKTPKYFQQGQSGAFGTRYVRFQRPWRASFRTEHRTFAQMRANAHFFHRKVADFQHPGLRPGDVPSAVPAQEVDFSMRTRTLPLVTHEDTLPVTGFRRRTRKRLGVFAAGGLARLTWH